MLVLSVPKWFKISARILHHVMTDVSGFFSNECLKESYPLLNTKYDQ